MNTPCHTRYLFVRSMSVCFCSKLLTFLCFSRVLEETSRETSVMLTQSIIGCIIIGITINTVVVYQVFKVRKIKWELLALFQNIAISDMVHLLLVSLYELLSDNFTIFFAKTKQCPLIYPIFIVTVSNTNLLFLLAMSYHLHKMLKAFYEKSYSKTSVKGSFLVCWITAFFLFSPQVFVEDLTQIEQTCGYPAMNRIINIRIAYWTSLLYLQIVSSIVIIFSLIFSYKKIRKLEAEFGKQIKKISVAS